MEDTTATATVAAAVEVQGPPAVSMAKCEIDRYETECHSIFLPVTPCASFKIDRLSVNAMASRKSCELECAPPSRCRRPLPQDVGSKLLKMKPSRCSPESLGYFESHSAYACTSIIGTVPLN